MFRLVAIDVVAALIIVGGLTLIVYLWLNNSKKTSKRISKFVPRNESIPSNPETQPTASVSGAEDGQRR